MGKELLVKELGYNETVSDLEGNIETLSLYELDWEHVRKYDIKTAVMLYLSDLEQLCPHWDEFRTHGYDEIICIHEGALEIARKLDE